MVAVAVLMTYLIPEAWGLVVLAAAGGVVLAVALVLVRRHHVPSGPSGSDPTILFRAEPVKQPDSATDFTESTDRPDRCGSMIHVPFEPFSTSR